MFAIFLLEMELRPRDELRLLILCDFDFNGFRVSRVVMPAEEPHGCDMRVLDFNFFQTDDEILRESLSAIPDVLDLFVITSF